MPGLIFEGDTTKRFGEKFPKPFIQEIRVFDTHIEADIILYFKISLEEGAEAFIGNLSDYDLYSGFGNRSFRDEINLENFNIVNEEIFNSEGERFIKLMLEKKIDFGSELSSASLSLESIIPNTGTEAEGRDGDLDFNQILFLNRFEDIGILGRDRESIVSLTGISPSSETKDLEQDFGIARVDVFDSVRNTFKDGPQDTAPTTINSGLFKFEDGTAISTIGDDAIAEIFGIGKEGKRLLGEFNLREFGSPTTTTATTDAPADESRASSITEITSAEAASAAAAGLTLQKYFYCCTTLKEDESSNLNLIQDLTIIDPTGGYNTIANSSSPLIYERIFKFDGTLSIDPVDAYQELDGNIYGQTPLMSLDRRYRKTDNTTHKTVIDSVNAVIAPYIGTDTAEADNIAVTLQTHKDDPRLLVKLSKQTKNFSNKSSVTVGGQLYGNMVDVVTSLDNALLLEDVLEKRRFANAKIKDRRGDISLVKDGDFTEGMNVWSFRYIYKPLISRGAVKTAAGNTIREEDVLESFIISNQSYYFFDYERCLNYETEISSFFNPHNLLQIFGNNALNGYFKIVSVSLEKSKAHSHRPGDAYSVTNLDLFYPTGDGGLLGGSNIASSYTYETTDSDNNFLSKIVEKRFSGAALDTSIIKNTIYSQIVERAFDTIDSIDGYRLKCYEIVDLESIEMSTRATTYVVKIEVRDTTMLFYKEYLQQPILKMYEELKRYLDFANDFCSFNNIDGRFNDFFIDSVGTQFDSPFPWHEGPLLYYSVLASLEASWEELGSKDVELETRKRRGSSIDLTLVKQSAILKSRQVSPSTGDLVSLRQFVYDFGKFKDYFEVGSGLDKNNEIYKTLLDGTLSLKRNKISKTFEITTQITEDINTSFDLSPDETEATFSPYLSFMRNSPLKPTVVRTQEAMLFYLNNLLEEQSFTRSASLDLERLRKKGEGDSYEHRLYFEKGIRWKNMFFDYNHLDSLSPRTKEILQIVFPYLKYLQSLPFSSDLSLSDILPGRLNGEDRS